MKWRGLCFCFIIPILLSPAASSAHDFMVMGGINLSSVRTASNSSYNDFVGMGGGVGVDFHIKEAFYVETDLLLVQRRYSAGYTMPTLFLPAQAKYENKFLTLGAGLYMGSMLGVSSDAGQPITLDGLALSSIDVGWILSGGFKLRMTRKMTAFANARLSRGFTNSTTSAGQEFYWSQVQGFVGFQLPLGASRL